MLKKLQGKKVAILSADGFEKVELTVPMMALKAQGADVDIISLHKGKIRGMNLHKPASTIAVDRLIYEVSVTEYDALLIPGGYINPDLLRQSSMAREFVRAFDEAKKPIASLCHGPWLLSSAGVLGGRTVTSWPGIRDDMVNAGATWLNQKVVADGNLVTSRGPQDLPFFVSSMIELFSKGYLEAQVNSQLEESDGQEMEPPMLVQQTISWISGFPYKWAAGAVVAGVGAYAIINNKGPFASEHTR